MTHCLLSERQPVNSLDACIALRTAMTNKKTAPDSDEETIYATALSEIQTDSVRPGLWAKAFADSEGNENKCKALYIKLRVQHEKDRIQQEHHSAHLAAVEAAQRKSIAFQYVIDNLASCGHEEKRSMNGWPIREPLGGSVKLKSDQALLDYAQGQVKIPAELSSKQATGNQLTSMQTDTQSKPEALAKEDPEQRVQSGAFDPAVLGTRKSDWSWKSFGLALLLAIIISMFAAAASDVKSPKNILWTVMWMYMSIEAWKYWKWKALLPYPMFLVAPSAIGLIMNMVGINLEKMSLTYVVIMVTTNIGGLIAF